MEDEQKHTPTEFIGNKFMYNNGTIFTIRKGGHFQPLVDIRGFGAMQNLFKNSKGQVDYEATLNFQDSVGEQIKEIIESYHTLKQQNEDLTAQLEKERKDKEAMAKLLIGISFTK